MPNDAKLALVIGVGLVVAVAILFFHKDFAGRPGEDRSPASVSPVPAAPPSGNGSPRRSLARPTGLVSEAGTRADSTVRVATPTLATP